jgi:glycosyltransferase involved in cell wall biosynthesis
MKMSSSPIRNSKPSSPCSLPCKGSNIVFHTGLIAVTKELQNWVNEEGQRQDCAFVSNGANTHLYKPGLPRPSDAPTSRYVLFFGGLTRWHGIETMLEAIQDANWPDDVQLVIIGKGQETPQVQQTAAQTKRFCYLGHKPYQEVAAYVSNALAGLVMISNPNKRSATGILPLKLFETLSCGIPALVSDLPGQADLVRAHQCGSVITTDDPQGLAKAVAALSQTPLKTREMGKNGREVVCKKYSWEICAQETLAFIQKILS